MNFQNFECIATTYPSEENMHVNRLDNEKSSLTVNLSKLNLTEVEISLLDKGLSYIPISKSLNVFKIYESQNRLIRNLKIKDYFSNARGANSCAKESRAFTGPSRWIPPDHHVSQPTLDTVQRLVKNTEALLKKSPIYNNCIRINKADKNNLTYPERKALDNLRNNESIIIKPADKGGATVIMNKLSYLNEAYRQLNNGAYYRRLDRPIYTDNIAKINNTLDSMYAKGLINRRQCHFLHAKESDRARVFYLLPKIHKDKIKWPQGDMPEGRPIVSDVESESYRVSKYIDSIIRPLSMRHGAYLKDSFDFVKKIRDQQIPSNALLCTCDVTALYTNMNFERTLRVTRENLDKFSPASKILNKYIMDLLEITLQNNDFQFNGDFFLQTCGTAMGKAYAPALADLYMLEFDNAACNGNFAADLVKLYFRFLDDVFFVFLGDVTELKNLENFLNSIIPGIKITLNYSVDFISFLDTTIYKHKNELDETFLRTKIYFKETDTHQLLHKESYHPKHTFKGIIKSQLLRFKRLSSTFTDYDNTCKILFSFLTKRNYSRSFLRKMKRDIWALPDDKPAAAAAAGGEDLPIVIPYSDIGHSASRSWKNIIKNNEKFNNYRLITAFSNSPNLRQKLVRSSIASIDTTTLTNVDVHEHTINHDDLGMHVCNSNRCKACIYIIRSNAFQSFTNKTNFKFKSRFTCKSSNLVYLITCRYCNLQYVGQTGRTLADRINDHLSTIRTKKSKPIALHFNLPNHSIRDFAITAIEKIPEGNNALNFRLLKECTWQNLLQTAYPLGINNLKAEYID